MTNQVDRRLTYYVVYRVDDVRIPAGLFVLGAGHGEALLWDHRCGSWAYDPGLVTRFLNDYRNVDRYDNIDRAEADQIAPTVTGLAGLPDEEAFHLLLVKGAAGSDGERPARFGAADPARDR
ncbi:hypothetical protein [Micromonospora ureilytica]|uniref:Uncharacterized protein n=1 Tax=Micromonospora ureilytica TaxID=709868 RepID=A0ABS0JL55_9ACTN|nr:hypothetical protein [Micromonospora ureilytica]MBG6067782.1 hypothetical protein [Micromonospora ureilytica]